MQSQTYWVPLVSNIHDISLVHTQYILICTCLYYYLFPVPVCTRYELVHTASEAVLTKTPIPVMLFTIPDARGPASGILTIWNLYFQYIPYIYYIYIYICVHGISMHIPCISLELDIHGISMDIPWIYQVYPRSIYMVYPRIYMAYPLMYIHGICTVHPWIFLDIPGYS